MMALVLGVNSGFVTTAPTSNPDGSTAIIDVQSHVTKDTSPAGAVKITEIGWWCDNATEEANFEVGLYAADGGVVPNEAGTLLQVSRTNAKGTSAGWKKVTVDWSISATTDYWLGIQLDNTSTTTFIDRHDSVGPGKDIQGSQSTLPNPFGGGTFTENAMSATYALVEIAAPASATDNMNIIGENIY